MLIYFRQSVNWTIGIYIRFFLTLQIPLFCIRIGDINRKGKAILQTGPGRRDQMENAKLNGKKTYEYVFDYFSEQILSGKLKLNDKLETEREIAEKLGVSRNSIREVMHMLEITGLIECLQGSGNYIRCDPMEYMLKSVNMVMALMEIDFSEIFDIRTGYEYTAVRLAIDAARPEELEEMHQILLKMDQPMSVKESAQLDIEFHHKLMNASHNRMLILYSSMLYNLMDQFIENFRARILTNRMRAELLRRSHWGIYNGLVEKDLEAAMKGFDKHFRIVEEQLQKLKQKEAEQPPQ